MLSQGIARGVISNWVGLAVAVAISFVLSPIVVNKLGSVYYGIWALTLQFTGYLHLLDFGVRESVIRYTSKYSARRQSARLNAVLTTAVLTYLPLAVLSLLVTLVCVLYAPGPFEIDATYIGDMRAAVFFTGLTITQSFVFNVFTGIIQGLRRYDLANGIGITFSLVRGIVFVWLLSHGYGLVGLAVAQFALALLGGLANAFVALSLLRHEGMPFTPRIPRGRRVAVLARRIFGYGFYSLLHTVGQKLVFSSDAVLIGAILSVRAITPYAIAGSLVDNLRMLVGSSARVFFPALSSLRARGRHDEMRHVFMMGARLTVVIAMPIGITFALLGDVFVGLWMGKQYMVEAGAVLCVLGLTQIASAPHNVAVSALYGVSQHKVIALLRIGEAVVNVSLSAALAYWLGLVGVALGTAISHVILVLFVLPYFISRIIGVHIREYLLGSYLWPAVAALPFGVALLMVRINLELKNLLEFFAVVGLLTVGYAVCVYLIALDDGERRLVLGRMRRVAAAD